MKNTPLHKNEQNEREISQWRLLFNIKMKCVVNLPTNFFTKLYLFLKSHLSQKHINRDFLFVDHEPSTLPIWTMEKGSASFCHFMSGRNRSHNQNTKKLGGFQHKFVLPSSPMCSLFFPF